MFVLASLIHRRMLGLGVLWRWLVLVGPRGGGVACLGFPVAYSGHFLGVEAGVFWVRLGFAVLLFP